MKNIQQTCYLYLGVLQYLLVTFQLLYFKAYFTALILFYNYSIIDAKIQSGVSVLKINPL